MSYWDKKCPTNSRDAYYEGRNSREYDRNPYEHGRHDFMGDCRDAYDEWKRGARAAEYDRELERQEQQEMEARRVRQEREWQREQEWAEAERQAEYERSMEAHQEEQFPEEPQPSE